MKIQRWDYQHLHGDFLIRRDDGDWCANRDVARIEASHAELLQVAKDVLALRDGGLSPILPKAFDVIGRLRDAIAKAEGGTP